MRGGLRAAGTLANHGRIGYAPEWVHRNPVGGQRGCVRALGRLCVYQDCGKRLEPTVEISELQWAPARSLHARYEFCELDNGIRVYRSCADVRQAGVRHVFCDRDGILNVDTGYPHRLSDLIIKEDTLRALSSLRGTPHSFSIVTNQSGIGRGLFSWAEFEEFTGALLVAAKAYGVQFAAIVAAPLQPVDGADYWRKPGPGMILLLANLLDLDLANCCFVGDRVSDMAAARSAGVKSRILLSSSAPEGRQRMQDDLKYVQTSDLARAFREHFIA